MNRYNHLYSRLLGPGAKIKISSKIKNRVHPPNSLMFIDTSSGSFKENPNIAILNGVLIRKGRRGKPRLEDATISTNIFSIEREVKGLKSEEYKGYPFTDIIPLRGGSKNVLDMDSMDFLGWATAYYAYLTTVYRNGGITKRWPQRENNPVNLIGKAKMLFNQDPALALDKFANENFRLNLVNGFRKMESSIAASVAGHRLKLSLAELKAAIYLIWDNLLENESLYNNKELYDNYLYYRKKYIESRKTASSFRSSDRSPDRVAGVFSVVRSLKRRLKMGKKKTPDFLSIMFVRRNTHFNKPLPNEDPQQGGIVINEDVQHMDTGNTSGTITFSHRVGTDYYTYTTR